MSREDQTRAELGAALSRLEEAGIQSYPHRFDRTAAIEAVREAYLTLGEAKVLVSLRGRVRSLRTHSTVTFLDLEDETGQLQVRAVPGELPAVSQMALTELRLGDIVGVEGRMGRTCRGEVTLTATMLQILAKCLRSLPDRRHRLSDGLSRDARYLELLTDPSARERLVAGSRIKAAIRAALNDTGFVEVETRVLQPVYGGAEAEPFSTYVNALDRAHYLRISPELDLKRLLVGGFDRVFEIGKNFRNEGMSAKHHPEFLALEAYQAGADYTDMMVLAEALIAAAAVGAAIGPTTTSRLRGTPVLIDLTPPFRRLTVLDGIREYAGVDISTADADMAIEAATRLGLSIPGAATPADAVMALFEHFVEPHLVQPTFVLDYPSAVCPLTKRHRGDPWLAERFELYVDGTEIANAYSELNDPREQRRQFEAQVERRAAGDQLAHPPDWDYVECLEYGMPPAGGIGIGIDRVVMLLTGAAHIQDVIAFPLRRS